MYFFSKDAGQALDIFPIKMQYEFNKALVGLRS